MLVAKITIKKILVFLVLCFCFQRTVYCQSYQSIFGDSVTTWNIAREIPDAVITDSLYTTKDSLFNGHLYKAVEDYFFEIGFIREDTLTGQVWFYDNNNDTEELIMNLSLTVGDTFFLNTQPWESNKYTIVDSVYFIDGKKHIRFDDFLSIANKSIPLLFTEGLGPNAGVLYQATSLSHNYLYNNYLLCTYKDGVQYHSDTIFNGKCYIFWTGIEESIASNSWTLFPNPFDEYTTIRFQNSPPLKCTLTIFDLQGRIVRTSEHISTEQIVIDREQLTSGLYIFQVSLDSKSVAYGKMAIK